MELTFFDLSLLIVYALICIGIGIWSSKGQKGEDYLIAGRKMRLWPFMASVVASYIGGAAIVAYTAYVYKFGVSAIAVFLGTSIGFLVFIPYALKLRRISSQKKFHTLSDWYYFKFNKKAGLISAIILFIVYFGMLLNQFIAGSSILASISGWSYENALLFSSIIISIYLIAGGFKSVVKTDVFQYIVLLVMFIFLGYILMKEDYTTSVDLIDISDIDIPMTIAFIAFGIFIIFQSAEYWQRVYAAKNEKVVRKGFIGSAILAVITGIAITLIGLAAHKNIPGIDARNAFAEGLSLMIPKKFLSTGLIMIFAAIMSSADTIIFVLASSLAKDYHSVFGKKSKKQNSNKLMRQTRIFIVLFSISGFVFAFYFRDIVAVIIFITGLGFTIIPTVIASFHYKIKNNAAIASLLSGAIYVAVLIISGNLIPELSIASIVVSALFLLIFQKVNYSKKNKSFR